MKPALRPLPLAARLLERACDLNADGLTSMRGFGLRGASHGWWLYGYSEVSGTIVFGGAPSADINDGWATEALDVGRPFVRWTSDNDVISMSWCRGPRPTEICPDISSISPFGN